jgi:hypothetical protein
MGSCAPEKGRGRETFSKKLGRFLRDPSVWLAGFQLQWKKNQHTLARRWWKKCQRGDPASDEELLSKFNAAGKKWRKYGVLACSACLLACSACLLARRVCLLGVFACSACLLACSACLLACCLLAP